jgi:transcriptional regulator with XRE-family HTH domain
VGPGCQRVVEKIRSRIFPPVGTVTYHADIADRPMSLQFPQMAGGGDLSSAVGQILRRARHRRGLTLRAIAERSSARFKPSSVGDYERGERRISVERFCELAALYGLPPDRLLGEALGLIDPPGRESVVVDLARLPLLEEPHRRLVAEFLHTVRDRRGDFVTHVITLRSGDIEEMALAAAIPPRAMRARLQLTAKKDP